MSVVYAVYEMVEEEMCGYCERPDLYIKEVVGIFVDKDKAIKEVEGLVKDTGVVMSARYVNGVEQDIMYWTLRSWRDRVLYKLEAQTLIDWE